MKASLGSSLLMALAFMATPARAYAPHDAGAMGVDEAGDAGDAGDAASQLARVTFEVSPNDVVDLQVAFDDRAVPLDKLDRIYSIDPGVHEATARGRRPDGGALVARVRVDAAPGSLTKVRLALSPSAEPICGPDCDAPMRCLQTAKTEEDAQKCLCGRDPQRAGCQSCVVAAGVDLAASGKASLLLILSALAFAARRRGLLLSR